MSSQRTRALKYGVDQSGASELSGVNQTGACRKSDVDQTGAGATSAASSIQECKGHTVHHSDELQHHNLHAFRAVAVA
jgi:hypothetical protein